MKYFFKLLIFLTALTSFAQNPGGVINAPLTTELDSLVVLKANKRSGHVPYTDFEAKLKARFDNYYTALGTGFTPTLQQVTTEGATTSNNITIANNDYPRFIIQNTLTNNYATYWDNSIVYSYSGGHNLTLLKPASFTGNYSLSIPAITANDTIALKSELVGLGGNYARLDINNTFLGTQNNFNGKIGLNDSSPSVPFTVVDDVVSYASGRHILNSFSDIDIAISAGVGGVFSGYWANGTRPAAGFLNSLGGLPLWLGTLNTNGDVQIEVDGTAHMPNATIAEITSRGAKAILTKEAADSYYSGIGASVISDTAYGVGWSGDTTTGASKNAIYDKFEALTATIPTIPTTYTASNITVADALSLTAQTTVEGYLAENRGLINTNTAAVAEHEIRLDLLETTSPTEVSQVHFTDFLIGNTTLQSVFLGTQINSGSASINTANLTSNNPGLVRITSSTTANSGWKWATDASSMMFKGGEVFTIILEPINFSTTTLRAGFIDNSTSADCVDGVYFEYSGSGNIVFKSSNNSVKTISAPITTLIAGNFYKLKITVNADATSVLGEVFNSEGNFIASWTITTNIPTTSARAFGVGMIVTDSSTTATAMVDVDYMSIKQMGLDRESVLATATDGLSAYQIALNNGFVGTEAEWLSSLVGAEGAQGLSGVDGLSAYEIAVNNGFVGTETEWLESLNATGVNTAFRTVTPALGVFTEAYNEGQPNASFTITQNTAVTFTTIANGDFGIVEVINATTTPYIVQLNGITNRTRTVTNETVSFTYTTNATGVTWYENYKTQASGSGESTNYAAQTGTGTSVINFTDNNFVDITLTANEVPTFTAPSTTTRDLTLYVRQDATGGRTFTFPTYEWGFAGGTRPTITSTPNALDIFKIDYLGGKYYVTSVMQNLVAVDTPLSYTIVARVNGGGTDIIATDAEINYEGGNSTPPIIGTNYNMSAPIGTGGVFGSAGVTWIRDASIPVGLPTADYDTLYDDLRYGDNEYTFPKGNGTYKITLYLAEDQAAQTVGGRVFDVIIDGVTVESNIDIRNEFGIGARAVAKVYDNIVITDGVLNLTTNSTTNLVLVAGFQIEKQD